MTPHPQEEPEYYLIEKKEIDFIGIAAFTNREKCSKILAEVRTRPAPTPAASEIKTCFDLKEYGESIRKDERNQTLDELRKKILESACRQIPSNNLLGQHLQLGESHAYGKCLEYIESLRIQQHERGDPR